MTFFYNLRKKVMLMNTESAARNPFVAFLD